MLDEIREFCGPERDVDVGSARHRSDVPCPHRLAHDAARSIGTDYPSGEKDTLLARFIRNDDLHVVRAMSHRQCSPPEQQLNTVSVGEVGAQYLFNQWLSNLLSWLWREVSPGVEPETRIDVGDLPADQRLNEGDALGPLALEGRHLAKTIGDPPSAKVLHRAHRCRLCPRARVFDDDPRLDDYDADTVERQLFGESQPDRTTTNDQNGQNFIGHVQTPVLGAVFFDRPIVAHDSPHVADTFNEWHHRQMTMTPRRGGRPATGEPVLDRAFRLLDAFSDERTNLTLTALSERTGIPLSTTLRLAQHLGRLGALERQPDGTFTMGLRMLEYAALAPRGHGLRSIALPYMEDLHRATRQHVLLAVRENDEAVMVERLSAPGAGKVLYSVGGRVPLHGTGLGLVLLAHSRIEFQETYLKRELFLEPEHTAVTAKDIRAELQSVRTTGVAHMSRALPEPAASVAAPIFDRVGSCVAAISVLGADGSLDPRALEPAVVAIARAISRDLKRSGR